ncbi:type IV pilus biogenesis/stability protein PilW [Methylophilus sp. 3sh_L]|uniref:type IV pilus biogenesis/stability protein PilW n=1 Tax=Methylophilus sp. 3sh_L TaxID=3377114 RepID=UPI00398EC06D
MTQPLHTPFAVISAVALLLWLPGCAQNPSSSNQNQPYDQQPIGRESGDVESARVHTELGAEYFRLKRYDVALEEFNTAIERSPNYALAYNGLGLVYAALGEKSRAEAAFKRAIQLQPGSSESHNNYGRFLCDQGQYDASQKEFLQAVKNPLYKTPQIALYNAGVCALRAQQKPQAEQYFYQALQIDPLAHASAYQLANLQFGRGEAQLALNTLQNSVNVAPTPESLFLAVRICRALQLADDANYYSVQLHKLFPTANETKQLLKME